jgi:hypothetical protein
VVNSPVQANIFCIGESILSEGSFTLVDSPA